jgi:hypothetical protein
VRLATLAGSVLAHAVALALIAPLVRREPAAALPASPVEEAAPIDVEIIEQPEPRNYRQDAAEPRYASRGASSGVPWLSGALAMTQGLAPQEPGHEAGATSKSPARPTGSLYMHMRGPELHLSDADADHILDNPEAPPAPVFKSGRLDSAPGGRGRIRDAVTNVEVERDGTAHFHDTPDIDVHLRVPIPSLDGLRHSEEWIHEHADEAGKSLRKWYDDPYAQTRKRKLLDHGLIDRSDPAEA